MKQAPEIMSDCDAAMLITDTMAAHCGLDMWHQAIEIHKALLHYYRSQCTGCAVTEGAHKPAGALQQIQEPQDTAQAAAPTQEHARPAAAAGPVALTFMTEDQARKWAWDKVRVDLGTKGWTAGDSCNFHGFFRWGWVYRGQHELQRTATMDAVKQELAAAPAHPAEGVIEKTLEQDRMTAGRATYFMERFLREEKLLGPNEQAALHFAIDMLAQGVPAPAAQDEPPMPIIGLPVHQLRDALYFATGGAPISPEDIETQLCFQVGNMQDDDGIVTKGMRCWLYDYPEDGCCPLNTEPTAEVLAQAQAEDARDLDDAALIEWLSGQYLAADYQWGDPKTPVLVIEIPPKASVCGDFRTDVRAAIAAQAAGKGE